MRDETVIKVEHLSKKYCKELRHTMLYGVQDIARNAIGLPSNSGRIRNGEFWALEDISFEVKMGETLGIIGSNGSGKTTLLKLLNGILMPDKGRIEIRGKVGALIEIGAGFHPMLTGRENIYVNGTILGMSKKEIDKKFDDIVDFAGIGAFIDAPVKHYSSGMYVRLGFAIAVHCEPDILVIDEVLAVGDMEFQIKCFKKIDEFKNNNKNLIIVSHDMRVIKKICDRTILLNNGVLKYNGSADRAIDIVFDGTAENAVKKTCGRSESPSDGKQVSKIIFFDDVRMFNEQGDETNVFHVGQNIIIRVGIVSRAKVDDPVFGGIVYSDNGVYLAGFNSLVYKERMTGIEEGMWEAEYRLKPFFLQGTYHLTLAIHDETGRIVYDIQEKKYSFVVKADRNSLPYTGYVKIPCEWKMQKKIGP